jgi:hypothetical protein
MHYDLNNIKVKNVISCNNDIHFEGECEYDECILYTNKGNGDNNTQKCKINNKGNNLYNSYTGNKDNNILKCKINNKGNKDNKDNKGNEGNNIYKSNKGNGGNKGKEDNNIYNTYKGNKGKDDNNIYNTYKSNEGNNIYNSYKGNDDNKSNKLIKFINNYEIKCIYKINMNNYYKNINIYNYKNKIII